MGLWIKYGGGTVLRKTIAISLDTTHIVARDENERCCYIQEYTTPKRAKEVFDDIEKFIASSDSTKYVVYELPDEGSVDEESNKRWRQYYEGKDVRNMLD